MKIIIALVCTVLSLMAAGQPSESRQISLDENTIVKDSSGMVYAYDIWRKLLQSGNFALKPVNMKANPPELLIYPLTAAEKQARLSKLGKPRESNYFTTGTTISNFNEKDMNGNRYNLKNLKGKVVAINFWFINCPPCKAEIPELNQVVSHFSNNPDVVFIAIALDDYNALKDFLKETPFNYNIIDNGRYIAQQYKVVSYPTHVILDKEGKVVFHTTGLAPNTVSWVKQSIEAALK